MSYSEQAPSTALGPYVEAHWAIDAGDGAPAHRVLPDGCIDLIFDAASGARVVGPMTRAIVAPPAGRGALVFGVRFHPGEAVPFLQVAARDLRDHAIPLSDVWGPAGHALEDAVVTAPTHEARVRAVERVLLARLLASRALSDDRAAARVRGSVAALRASSGRLAVDALAGRLGVAARTLERLFDEHVGVGPKLFARVVRLQSLVSTLDRSGAPSWSAIAAGLSFADQAHLVREVGALAGATPTQLLCERRAVSDFFNRSSERVATVPPSPLVSPNLGRR